MHHCCILKFNYPLLRRTFHALEKCCSIYTNNLDPFPAYRRTGSNGKPENKKRTRHDFVVFFCRCEEPRFVRGWYRPASRATSGSASPYQQATARAAAATVHSTTGEESIYETADHPPSCRNACNTPDSERYAPHAPTRHRR